MTHVIVDLFLFVLLPALLAWYLPWRFPEAASSTLTTVAGLTPVAVMAILAVLLALTWGDLVAMMFIEFLTAILWLDRDNSNMEDIYGRLLIVAPLSVAVSIAVAALVMRRRRGPEAE